MVREPLMAATHRTLWYIGRRVTAIFSLSERASKAAYSTTRDTPTVAA